MTGALAEAWAPLVSLINADEVGSFASFIYPLHQKFLARSAKFPFLGVGIKLANEPCGFAFGIEGSDSFEIASLRVHSCFAGGGLEEALLARLVDEFGKRGINSGVFHATFPPDGSYLSQTLIRCGWRGPRIRQVNVVSTVRALLELQFVVPLGQLRPGYSIIPWNNVTESMLTKVEEELSSLSDKIRSDINPINYVQQAAVEHSFILLRGSTPIGWHLPERRHQHTLRWTCSTVLPRYQVGAPAIQLWLHALRQQAISGIPNIKWGTAVEHPRMVRFILQKLKPALQEIWFSGSFYLGSCDSQV